MKPLRDNSSRRQGPTTTARAFTTMELITAMAVFMMVVAGIVSVPIFGLKVNAMAVSKLNSSTSSMKVLNQIRNQVLGANSVLVGNGTQSSFVANGTNGNALQIYPNANTNTYVRFFMSTNTDALYEWNSATGNLWLLAPSVTNHTVFQTVDYRGNISSSSQEHYSIRMILQFAELNYRISTNNHEYYTLETEMTPRCQ
jgi:hypothetical protein